jgi:hypothetical protein
VFLLKSMAHSNELESSLKNKNQSLHPREREGVELKIWISMEALLFHPRVRWGSIYSPHLKRVVGGSFIRLVRCGHWTSPMELSESRSGLD